MKTNFQTQKMKLIFLLTLFVILLQSCSKEPDLPSGNPITKYEYLTAGALNQTPYFTNPAFDTISFASDKGDTLTFVKTKTDTTWYFENGSGSPDCGFDKVYSQTLKISYITIKGNGSFYVKHVLNNGQYRNILNININNDAFEPYDDQIGLIGYPTYKQETTILNNTYYSLIVIFSNPEDTSSNEAYINKNEGLFYYHNKKENTVYTLLKK